MPDHTPNAYANRFVPTPASTMPAAHSFSGRAMCCGAAWFAAAGVLAIAGAAIAESNNLTDPPIARDAGLTLNQTLPGLDTLSQRYMEHVIVLASSFFEGRQPGTRGDTLSTDYASWHFQRLGLLPAFATTETHADGTEIIKPNTSWLQRFEVGGRTELVDSSAQWTVNRQVEELVLDESYSPLGFSGNGEVNGPLVFVGYAIEDGPDGYSSFEPDMDLNGKIAVVLRFEPMDPEGRSLWGNRGRWSNAASMAPKMQAIADRGAAGIILLQPPGADDPRSRGLESVSTTNFGFELDIPVVMLSTDAAKTLVESTAPDGLSLLDLRRKADTGEVKTLDLNAQPTRFSMAVELETIRTPTNNVAAVLPGRGPLADEFVVIGGHIDHLGYGDRGSRYRGEERLIHHGADDNASGTAGVLIAAEVLAEQYAEFPDGADARSILFILFGGEEMGLLGARHFVANTELNASNTTAMLNMDMIGRLGQNDLTISGTGTAPEWGEILDPVIERMGFDTQKSPGGMGPSDHAWFFRSDIPALHFFSGLHDDYHHPRDTWNLLHYTEATRLSVGVAEIAKRLAMRPEQLTFDPSDATQRRTAENPGEATDPGQGRPQLAQMRVRMGIMPGNYDEGAKGLEIGGVTPGGSADEAGLQAGDVILLWNGEELAGVGGLMSRLAEANPGDVVDLVVRRGDERLELKMTMQAREVNQG